jgi:poly(hydroxyalkanoate) depolymerase family esterase
LEAVAMPVRRAAVVLAVLAALVATAVTPGHAATGGSFGGVYANGAGARAYQGYVPSSYRAGVPVPLVVALHGCTETAGDFARVSRLSALAEQRGFIVVYPEQSVLANAGRCWNWFLPTNQVRGTGEPSLIAGVTALVRSRYTVDPRRVYVTGGSAGAVMSIIMGVAYPDVYAALGSVAGCEYRCDPLGLRSPREAGESAYQQMGTRARPVPVILFQGTADLVVPPSTAARIVGQWARTDDLAMGGDGHMDAVADSTGSGSVPGGRTFTHAEYRSDAGTTLIDEYLIDGAGHAYPGGCGCDVFGDPAGPDASTLQWEFFLAHPRPA